MSRITIEDALKNVDNVYYLIHFSAYRAHQLEKGMKAKVDENGDAPTVVALREIAAGYTEIEDDEEQNTGN